MSTQPELNMQWPRSIHGKPTMKWKGEERKRRVGRRLQISNQLCLAAAIVLAQTGPAKAYVDPNAGGLIFQILMPLLSAVWGIYLLLRRWLSRKIRELWRTLATSWSGDKIVD